MMAMPRDRSRAPHPGWLLDEVAHAGTENLDAGHVARYDTKEDGGAADEVLLLEELGLTSASTVIDIGAGTGQFAMAVASACARVFAVDVSRVMLDRLRANIADRGLTNVDVVEAGFLTYAHGEGAVDFVYSRYALHHLPDLWKAVALVHIRDMLRPGGVFRLWDVVYNFDPGETEDRLEAWCAGAGLGAAQGWSARGACPGGELHAELAPRADDGAIRFRYRRALLFRRRGVRPVRFAKALISRSGAFSHLCPGPGCRYPDAWGGPWCDDVSPTVPTCDRRRASWAPSRPCGSDAAGRPVAGPASSYPVSGDRRAARQRITSRCVPSVTAKYSRRLDAPSPATFVEWSIPTSMARCAPSDTIQRAAAAMVPLRNTEDPSTGQILTVTARTAPSAPPTMREATIHAAVVAPTVCPLPVSTTSMTPITPRTSTMRAAEFSRTGRVCI